MLQRVWDKKTALTQSRQMSLDDSSSTSWQEIHKLPISAPSLRHQHRQSGVNNGGGGGSNNGGRSALGARVSGGAGGGGRSGAARGVSPTAGGAMAIAASGSVSGLMLSPTGGMNNVQINTNGTIEDQMRQIDKVVKECENARKNLEVHSRRLDELTDEVKRYRDFLGHEKARRDPALYKTANIDRPSVYNDNICGTMGHLTAQLTQEWTEKLRAMHVQMQQPPSTPGSRSGDRP